MIAPLDEMSLPDCLEQRDDGAIAVRGHRVSLHLILQGHYSGLSERQIHERFPSLSRENLRTVIAFCEQHPQAVRQYYDRQQSISQQALRDEHRAPSLDELRKREESRSAQSKH